MSKILVAYFSAEGTTKAAAEKLAQAAGADLYAIRPEVPYSRADLDWTNKKSRSSVEMKDPGCRPALSGEPAQMDRYDTILLGFPIWWYTAPRIISSFLEQNHVSGKRIILFATSGGSGFGKTADDLRASVPAGTVIEEGKMLNSGLSEENLKKWLDSIL